MFAVRGGRRTVSSRGSPSRTISNLLCIGFGGAVSVMGIFLGVVTHRGYFIVTIVTVSILLTMACCAVRERWCRMLSSITLNPVPGEANKSLQANPSVSDSACSSTYIRMDVRYGGRSMSLPNMGAWNFRQRGKLGDVHDSPTTRSTFAI